jgi:hypothetical protein
MNRCLTFSLAVSMSLSTLAIPLRAATQPRAGKPGNTTELWTNDDLEKLGPAGLISIVGQTPSVEDATSSALPSVDVKTHDPEWYAEQAAKLRDELERTQVQLREYRQALDDALSFRETNNGINLNEGHLGSTPEAGIEILQQRINQTEAELYALDDLARRNDIPPGTLRG